MATALLLLLLTVPMLGVSDAAWCVCRSDASSTALQKTLDYACGAGADCSPIMQVGACYNPNTVLAHCSYAANSYYQKNGQGQTACDFSGTAMLTSSDPSCGGYLKHTDNYNLSSKFTYTNHLHPNNNQHYERSSRRNRPNGNKQRNRCQPWEFASKGREMVSLNSSSSSSSSNPGLDAEAQHHHRLRVVEVV